MKSLKLLLRFMVVGGLILLLLVPLLMIRGTVQDRQRYRDEAVQRVSQSMAGPQQLAGPLRVVPWKETREVAVEGDAGKFRTETVEGYDLQTPATLRVDGGMRPDTRRIGLYDVRVFEWKAKLKAAFEPMDLDATAKRTYGTPYLVIGLADVRGLVGTPRLRVDGKPLALESGTGALGARMTGVHAALPAGGMQLPASQLELDLSLAGTQSLGIAPVADSNHIAVDSAWPHPLFGGRFLPNQRRIGAGGFDASWEISSLASAAQAQLADGERKLIVPVEPDAGAMSGPAANGIDSAQISLVDPIDVYTQADRASKYGILFVVLTFVGFGLFELIKRLPIHPLQYLLVGLALAIFFLLLLSLSEHIAFWKAYMLSAAACIGLQFFYLSGVLKSWWRAAGFAAMLTALYGVLYSLLVLEDSALLMGSLLLFGILAAIMWITRKVDWYDVVASLR
ncbi:cell envelope integrity protein CreD [Pseudoxanthomonas helianthi]|uniref:Cell envelope integrity protein CreD n=1 Tax=Pseudoxanthomonas helianthi TaxID=1453541 RepID=A0A940X4G2_9GAMM|nr:cell envelope integrity protein CreD [Pseudoxanthomonas helianthi]MBP3985002.1 cell envelope integrity protein CreD [Pseudoxanthomonas helianthi]